MSVGKVDLHIHTTASDGKFSPSEIVGKAFEQGLRYIAICDHDSIAGVAPAQEASKNYSGLTVFSGVEINTDIPSGELHVLGYLCDCRNDELNTALEKLRNSRLDRALKITQKLRKLGFKIDYERVREIAGTGSVGRPHIAQALLERGYISNLKEAFNRYISRGGPAFVERDKITPVEAVQLVSRARGIPVMAHPFTCENPDLLIGELKAAGLAGIEAFYGSYSPEQISQLLDLANKYALITTGGSDFHGLAATGESPLGTAAVPLECAERLLVFMGSSSRV
jgi:predicted metal-dependent phosphoesterase TrpH